MNSSFTLIKGSVPLLISMPHNGEKLPEDIACLMTPTGRQVPDTDWYKDKLYDFALDLGAYIIKPTFSRYVIDLNRDPNGVELYPGANSTELCPTTSFDLTPLYREGKQPSAQDIQDRITQYWQPYHQALRSTLDEIKQRFSKAVLLDAHSIKSQVPRFFAGQLPDFNFGTVNGTSCDLALIAQLASLDLTPYSRVLDGRFKGGFITRHYGDPQNNIHAVQLELSQRTYLNEENFTYQNELAKQVKPKLRLMVQSLIEFAEQ